MGLPRCVPPEDGGVQMGVHCSLHCSLTCLLPTCHQSQWDNLSSNQAFTAPNKCICTTMGQVHPRTSYVASSVEELEKVVEENSLQQEKSSQCIENTCSVCVPSVSPLTNQLLIVRWLRGTVVYILVNQYRRLAYNGETIIMITMLMMKILAMMIFKTNTPFKEFN